MNEYKTIMIFDTSVNGHHIEYIHHIYEGMAELSNFKLLMVVPYDFEKKKNLYKWDNSVNHEVILLDEHEVSQTQTDNILRNSYERTLLLRKYIKTCKPDKVFLIMLMGYMPFMAFMIPGKEIISGIIYKIYLYKWKEMSFVRKFMEVCNYMLMKVSKCISVVFILNDKPAVRHLNTLYKTNKYRFLPDPFNDIGYKGRNLRDNYDISPQDTVFFHFGAMSERKGTIEILDAIRKLTDDEAKNKVFIFAGSVSEEIQKDFSCKVEALKNKCRIIVYDKFCSNEELADLCVTSDYIMCPYKASNLSSGAIGYAAKYNKPVIGPKAGLLGKIIRRYKLGMTLKDIDGDSIHYAMCIIDKVQFANNSEYINLIKKSEFCRSIIDNVVLKDNFL